MASHNGWGHIENQKVTCFDIYRWIEKGKGRIITCQLRYYLCRRMAFNLSSNRFDLLIQDDCPEMTADAILKTIKVTFLAKDEVFVVVVVVNPEITNLIFIKS